MDARMMESIERAKCPEDLFGSLVGTPEDMKEELRKRSRPYLAATHPDKYIGDARQDEMEHAYQRVSELVQIAEAKIDLGVYGDRKSTAAKFAPVTIATRKHSYLLTEELAEGDIADIYLAEFEEGGVRQKALVKIARDPADNDLLENEARVLTHLCADTKAEARHFQKYLPRLIESCKFGEKGKTYRCANVLSFAEGYYTLKEVIEAYPEGVDARTLAWMWKRLLEILPYVHYHNVIHGAIVPTHVLIHPKSHGLMLIDWCYALSDPKTSKQHIRAVSAEHEDFYPPEVMAKQSPKEGTDIFMAARTMLAVAGATSDGGNTIVPDRIPKPVQHFLRACALPNLAARGTPAWDLLEEFNRLLGELYGPPSYHPFRMPRAT